MPAASDQPAYWLARQAATGWDELTFTLQLQSAKRLEAAAVGRPDAYAGELPVVYASLKTGHRATPEELLEFARERIPERAAIPKAVYLLDELPTPAVGKIFKPQLVWWETERVLRQEMTALGKHFRCTRVTVDKHELHGCLARVVVKPWDRRQAATLTRRIEELLGRYPVPFELEVA